VNLSGFAKELQHTIKHNAPAILTAVGVSGALGTAYLTGVATWKARGRLSEQPPPESKKELVAEVWDLYIPPAISGIVTVTCIIGANHVSSKRAAAAYSVLALTEKTFAEYKEHVVEKLGERKEQAIRDDIAQARVLDAPPSSTVIYGRGEVLCCELFTGRYFNSDMETLRKAQNDINAQLVREMYASLNDFYYMIKVPQTSYSGNIGWNSDRFLELEFSTVMSDDSRPCIAFDYNYTKPL